MRRPAAVVLPGIVLLIGGFGCSQSNGPTPNNASQAKIAAAMAHSKPMKAAPPTIDQLKREKTEVQNNPSLPTETKNVLLMQIEQKIQASGGH